MLRRVDLEGTIACGRRREVAYALVSSAENSSIDCRAQYGYIEDIGDGRGYTAGIVGFCSGTGDLLQVIRRYTELRPVNPLRLFIPALERVDGTDSHEGLGPAFVSSWKRTALDPLMVTAQDALVDELYLLPAVHRAEEDGLSPLGQFVYYDALVMHGEGEDEDGFPRIRSAALRDAALPVDGGDEATYLLCFLNHRAVAMSHESAHRDLSRLDVQRLLVAECHWSLLPPLSWSMYGDGFEID